MIGLNLTKSIIITLNESAPNIPIKGSDCQIYKKARPNLRRTNRLMK